jgi:hypothetical protein
VSCLWTPARQKCNLTSYWYGPIKQPLLYPPISTFHFMWLSTWFTYRRQPIGSAPTLLSPETALLPSPPLPDSAPECPPNPGHLLVLTLPRSAPGACRHSSSTLPYCRHHSLLGTTPVHCFHRSHLPFSPIPCWAPAGCCCMLLTLPSCSCHSLLSSTPHVSSQPWTPSPPNFPCGVPDASRRSLNAPRSCCCLTLLGSAHVGFLGRSHPSSSQRYKWSPQYLPPSAAHIQISGEFHPKLPRVLLCPDTNGADQNPEVPAGDNDCIQNNVGVQTPRVKCKVPDVGNPNNANCCDAQGPQSNFDRHPLTCKIPALTCLCLEKLCCDGHVAAMSALWQDWFCGGIANF